MRNLRKCIVLVNKLLIKKLKFTLKITLMHWMSLTKEKNRKRAEIKRDLYVIFLWNSYFGYGTISS